MHDFSFYFFMFCIFLGWPTRYPPIFGYLVLYFIWTLRMQFSCCWVGVSSSSSFLTFVLTMSLWIRWCWEGHRESFMAEWRFEPGSSRLHPTPKSVPNQCQTPKPFWLCSSLCSIFTSFWSSSLHFIFPDHLRGAVKICIWLIMRS